MFLADTTPAPVAPANARNTGSTSPWKQIVEPVEPFLSAVSANLARQVKSFDPALTPYAEYALTAGGKHLRPALVALSANALGRLTPEHVTVATIIEMVHLATLVHDDVMDEADMRRGRRTLASQWGNDIAVLFGDCLFAQALRMAAGFPTPEVCRAVATATNTVCTGEILQTRSRANFELPLADYYRMIEMKTAELFGLSCDMAAFLAEAGSGDRRALRNFGMAFGTAYQIYDDCVDLFGSEAAAGKSLGTDLVKGKMTLPLLLLREALPAGERAELRKILTDWQPESLPQLAQALAGRRILKPCCAAIHEQLVEARRAVAAIGSPAGRESLGQLADYLELQVARLADGQ